jgi:hypothetical protein
MTIATITLDRLDSPDFPETEVERLQDIIVSGLYEHFGTFNDAARAQAEHRYGQK